MPEVAWHDNPATLVDFLRWYTDTNSPTASEIVDVVEKPWHYEDAYAEYSADLSGDVHETRNYQVDGTDTRDDVYDLIKEALDEIPYGASSHLEHMVPLPDSTIYGVYARRSTHKALTETLPQLVYVAP